MGSRVADHFKALNDTFGHAAGDAALAAIGTRLTEWVGKRGAVGRLGGDEFAALTRIRPRRLALRLRHLRQLLAEPVTFDGEELPVAVSAGAATPDAVGAADLPVLLRAAGAAMYEGKHKGVIVQARPHHAHTRSVNGRREGRPGTAHVNTAT
ncbi:diguanylate cyclase domain-containing protein [Streptomyces sp. A5-4]|uniref:diguanylate cyclase domain-containing protein n=1 Tax=Streptomyces sp. A5-4 TaxID=3384771 RepID=UPI003DA8843E